MSNPGDGVLYKAAAQYVVTGGDRDRSHLRGALTGAGAGMALGGLAGAGYGGYGVEMRRRDHIKMLEDMIAKKRSTTLPKSFLQTKQWAPYPARISDDARYVLDLKSGGTARELARRKFKQKELKAALGKLQGWEGAGRFLRHNRFAPLALGATLAGVGALGGAGIGGLMGS